jgi:ornithine carbamoyltransferase
VKRDFLTLSDLGDGGVLELLDRSAFYERTRGTPEHGRPLEGMSVALLFEKPSTRTRVSLEVATVELGGHPVPLEAATSQIGRGEPIEDTARTLSRMVHGIAIRTSADERLAALARAARVPVLNALSDGAHPLQVLADLHTVRAARGSLEGLRCAWIGDASNVARSWIEAAGLLRFELALACPDGYGPPEAEVALACARGGRVTITKDASEAARGVDVLVTDVWVSMGQDDEAAARRTALGPYRVTSALVGRASRDVVVLHCLPAHRGEEIDADVVDGPRSFAWEAVEARLHTAKAALAWALASKATSAGDERRWIA